MNGHFENCEGEPILWPDAHFERIEADYEDCIIHVCEDTGVRRTLRCCGYIGFRVVGFWDEAIIEKARVFLTHPFIDECEQIVKSLPENGAQQRVALGNKLLEITLVDGCRIWVCAYNFVGEQPLIE